MEDKSSSLITIEPLDISYPSSIASPNVSSDSNPTPESSVNGSEDIFLPPVSYEPVHSAGANTGRIAVPPGFVEKSKFRCLVPQCRGRSFNHKRDLKRHEKRHNSNAKLWYCGCCQNSGDPYRGQVRKDKVQDHLRRKHDKSQSGDNKGIPCLVEGCFMLFTTGSCLHTHLRQEHPSEQGDRPTQTNNAKTCDCIEMAESKKLPNARWKPTHRHRTASPTGPSEKRVKYRAAVPQDLELPSHFPGCSLSPVSTTNPTSRSHSLTGPISTEDWSLIPTASASQSSDLIPLYDCDMSSQVNISQWNGAFDPMGGVDFTEMANSDQGTTYSNLLPNLPTSIPSFQIASRPFVLSDTRPADFLSIRRTQGFLDWVNNLRSALGNYVWPPASLTYNPEKETVTLTGFPQPVIEKAMNELFRLLNEFSQRLGGKYLETSEAGVESTPSAIRSRTRDFSDARNNSDLEQTRVFPIRPKDDPGLVRLWFRYILPALHKVLSPSIGGTYAATLVRRGQRRISTEPCIQIESPRIPGQKAKSIIRHSLNDICQRSNHQLVSIRFLQGTVKRLSGGMEKDDDDVGESPESQRLKFNLFRPFSKPRMGSSLGLKCSQESSATLGGYVLIGVDKYMLTSEHFVARSQEPANVDGDDTDLVTITSPSRQDLNSMENDLKQTKRDLYSQIDQQTKEIYGNRDIPAGDEAFPLDDLHNKIENVTSLLEQVKKPPHAYAIGTVFRRSIEPKKGPLERSIARAIGLEDDVREYMYHMDWALCKLNDQISRNGENRHKYQSDQVAMTEDYIEEDNYNHQAGDVCHETCEVESGVSVFYIGRGSRRRSGVVNLPGFISRNSVKTLDWGIMSSDGQGINSSDVEADSGAWVVRQSDNKVVGQVHSYSSRQVLFTPIDVIFDDIKEDVEEDVCLPPHQGGTGQIVIATDAIALCSGPNTSPPKSYKFLMPSIKALESPSRLLAVEAAQSETPPPGPPRISEIQDVPIHEQTQDASGPPDDSTSLLPSLTTSPESPATVPASPETPPPLELADQSDVQTDQLDEQLLSESLPTIRSHLKFPESPAATDKRRGLQGLKLLAYQLQHGTPIHLRLRATRRTSTWPVVRESKISKVHLKGSAFVRHPRSRDHVPGTSHEEAQRFARRIEDIGDIKLPAGNKIRVSKRKVRISPMLEDIGERGSSPIPEYSSVAA